MARHHRERMAKYESLFTLVALAAGLYLLFGD